MISIRKGVWVSLSFVAYRGANYYLEVHENNEKQRTRVLYKTVAVRNYSICFI